jgi:hypothetical protein
MIIAKFEVFSRIPIEKRQKKEKSRRKVEGIPPGFTGRSPESSALSLHGMA